MFTVRQNRSGTVLIAKFLVEEDAKVFADLREKHNIVFEGVSDLQEIVSIKPIHREPGPFKKRQKKIQDLLFLFLSKVDAVQPFELLAGMDGSAFSEMAEGKLFNDLFHRKDFFA